MKTQKISLQGMKEIHDVACADWKKKIKSMTDPFGDTTLTNTQIEEMFSAASVDQAKVLKKWLKEPGCDINGWEDIGEFTVPYKNPKTAEERCLNAMVKGFAIAKAFNQGKDLTWENRDDYKYLPYKYFHGDSWVPGYCNGGGGAVCPVGLAFKDSKSAMRAIELFPEVYEDLAMFNKGKV